MKNKEANLKRIQILGGYLELTKNELIISYSLGDLSELMYPHLRAIVWWASKTEFGFSIPVSDTRTIPLSLIDSIQLILETEHSWKTNQTLKIFGWKGNLPVGTLKIVTSSGGPDGTVSVAVWKEDKDEMIIFAEHLRLVTQKKGQSSHATTSDTKVCPECAEEVKSAAKKCRFCGHLFG